jgi:cytochrome c-type protein NapB
MRYLNLVVGITFMTVGIGSSCAARPIAADSMGLSKSSVFNTPSPKVYQYSGGQPGQNKLLPRAYQGAPPQIPHDIGDFLPITAQANMCIACHNQPEQWGKKVEMGAPTPIPPSHYSDHRNAPGKVTDHLINARYNCNQCHVPQADASALVENTFAAPRMSKAK